MTENKEFHEAYHAKEDSFIAEAVRFHEQNDAVQAGIRREVDILDEDREDRYRQAYEDINGSFESLANDFARSVEQDRTTLEKTVYAGTGDRFSEHLTALASVPDEQLATLMGTARRTGQQDLQRAVAMTSLERQGHSPLFEEWAQGNPDTADALERLRGLPDSDRLRTRALTMRPFKADPQALVPTQEDRDHAASVAAAKEASRTAFFGGADRPRRQVGRKVS